MIAKPPGFVNGAPLFLLRAEGLAVAILCIVIFSESGASHWVLGSNIRRLSIRRTSAASAVLPRCGR